MTRTSSLVLVLCLLGATVVTAQEQIPIPLPLKLVEESVARDSNDASAQYYGARHHDGHADLCGLQGDRGAAIQLKTDRRDPLGEIRMPEDAGRHRPQRPPARGENLRFHR